jgi:hypothetical protein
MAAKPKNDRKTAIEAVEAVERPVPLELDGGASVGDVPGCDVCEVGAASRPAGT